MNVIVCAKQVVDASEMKIDSSTKKPILQGVPQKISDIDKNAVEEAIKIKEKHGGKITVVTIGPANAKERIKELLAMGADEGIIVIAPDTIDYHMTATLVAEASKKIGSYDLILCGEASTDLFSGQIGPRVAGLLNIPEVFVEAAKVDGAGKFRSFFSIKVPLLGHSILFLAIYTIINAFQTFDFLFVMTSTGSTGGSAGGPGISSYVMSLLVYNEGMLRGQVDRATAVATIMLFFVLLFTIVQFKVLRPKWEY